MRSIDKLKMGTNAFQLRCNMGRRGLTEGWAEGGRSRQTNHVLHLLITLHLFERGSLVEKGVCTNYYEKKITLNVYSIYEKGDCYHSTSHFYPRLTRGRLK